MERPRLPSISVSNLSPGLYDDQPTLLVGLQAIVRGGSPVTVDDDPSLSRASGERSNTLPDSIKATARGDAEALDELYKAQQKMLHFNRRGTSMAQGANYADLKDFYLDDLRIHVYICRSARFSFELNA